MSEALPEIVAVAAAAAKASDFPLSCEPAVGALLAALSAAVPQGGRIAELGTGAGVGTAWLAHGLGERRDVELLSIDVDPALHEAVKGRSWPENVRFLLGDGAELLRGIGPCDLIFADAPSGKLHDLDVSIASLKERGMLVVDDMDLALHQDPGLRSGLTEVRQKLLANSRLLAVELDLGSGVILAVRR